LPFTAPGAKLKPVPLPGSYLVWLTAILISDSMLTQLVTLWHHDRFGSWL